MDLVQVSKIYNSEIQDNPISGLRIKRYILEYQAKLPVSFVSTLQNELTTKPTLGGIGTKILICYVDNITLLFVSCKNQPKYNDGSIFSYQEDETTDFVKFIIRVPGAGNWNKIKTRLKISSSKLEDDSQILIGTFIEEPSKVESSNQISQIEPDIVCTPPSVRYMRIENMKEVYEYAMKHFNRPKKYTIEFIEMLSEYHYSLYKQLKNDLNVESKDDSTVPRAIFLNSFMRYKNLDFYLERWTKEFIITNVYFVEKYPGKSEGFIQDVASKKILIGGKYRPIEKARIIWFTAECENLEKLKAEVVPLLVSKKVSYYFYIKKELAKK